MAGGVLREKLLEKFLDRRDNAELDILQGVPDDGAAYWFPTTPSVSDHCSDAGESFGLAQRRYEDSDHLLRQDETSHYRGKGG